MSRISKSIADEAKPRPYVDFFAKKRVVCWAILEKDRRRRPLFLLSLLSTRKKRVSKNGF